ncbi:MAG: hypothetical protein KBC64_06320 [Simkaniaceae bacterium]|nr:hypothetical protein [Simkaniaceae bacterium]
MDINRVSGVNSSMLPPSSSPIENNLIPALQTYIGVLDLENSSKNPPPPSDVCGTIAGLAPMLQALKDPAISNILSGLQSPQGDLATLMNDYLGNKPAYNGEVQGLLSKVSDSLGEILTRLQSGSVTLSTADYDMAVQTMVNNFMSVMNGWGGNPCAPVPSPTFPAEFCGERAAGMANAIQYLCYSQNPLPVLSNIHDALTDFFTPNGLHDPADLTTIASAMPTLVHHFIHDLGLVNCPPYHPNQPYTPPPYGS